MTVGRNAELSRIGELLDTEGGTRVLVAVGDPGSGKSTLLDAAAERAGHAGTRVLRVRGSESEGELAFAGLHQLLLPLLDGVRELPSRQRAELLGAFGLEDGPGAVSGGVSGGLSDGGPGDAAAPGAGEDRAGRPHRLLLSVAALTLLSDAAAHRPLLVVVDDAHWLDACSLDVLAFVARRLEGEPITMLVGARTEAVPPAFERDFAILPVEPLDEVAASRLLDLQPRPPAGRLRTRVLELAAGNPLALVELARAVADDPAAGRELWVADGLPLTARLERMFAAQLSELPTATREVLLLAAAADGADLSAVIAAGPDRGRPERALEAWRPAERAGLVRLDGDLVRFRHPLVRSAVYRTADLAARHAAHLALAEALTADPDRRAWHLAAATVTPDEEVAAALEATADRARRRGGYSAAAAGLERAARLSPDPEQQARRLVAAAEMAMYAGHPRWVGEMSARAAALTEDPAVRAEASVRAGWALAVTTRHTASLGFLLPVAEAAAEKNPALALDALSTATTPAYNSGDPALRGEIIRIAALVPPPELSGDAAGSATAGSAPADDATTGFATDCVWIAAGTEPFAARDRTLPLLRRAAALPGLRMPHMAILGAAAWVLDETPDAVRLLGQVMDHLRRTDTSGANATVAGALALAHYESGAWTTAGALADEALSAAAGAGLEIVVAGAPILVATIQALRGDGEGARRRVADATAGLDLDNSLTLYARARTALGLAAVADGDHQAAYDQFRALFRDDPAAPGSPAPAHYHSSYYGIADLAACAVRAGRTDDARVVLQAAVRRLGGDVSVRLDALLHRARALLAEPDDAEPHFLTALADPAGDRWPFERARTRLDYAEWLRRRRRVSEARPMLAAALDVFQRLGARPWADRAQAELRAAGVLSLPGERPPPCDALAELTPQQRQIVQLAAAGHTNREIGERLFLSPRTVGFHLYRIFPKLGITARAQLRDVLGPEGDRA